ncbi:hypothetical protein Q5752_005354 [Cryptotrichosporon argae]
MSTNPNASAMSTDTSSTWVPAWGAQGTQTDLVDMNGPTCSRPTRADVVARCVRNNYTALRPWHGTDGKRKFAACAWQTEARPPAETTSYELVQTAEDDGECVFRFPHVTVRVVLEVPCSDASSASASEDLPTRDRALELCRRALFDNARLPASDDVFSRAFKQLTRGPDKGAHEVVLSAQSSGQNVVWADWIVGEAKDGLLGTEGVPTRLAMIFS